MPPLSSKSIKRCSLRELFPRQIIVEGEEKGPKWYNGCMSCEREGEID